jgi:glycosyltransferase involved in cell wall biosynthesis
MSRETGRFPTFRAGGKRPSTQHRAFGEGTERLCDNCNSGLDSPVHPPVPGSGFPVPVAGFLALAGRFWYRTIMRRLRICQLITTLGPAGAERGVYELSRRLDRRQFDVQVVALQGGQVADWLRDAGVPVTVLGLRGKWDMLRLARLPGLLRELRPDVLHTHLFHADLAGRPAASLAAVPHLVHTVWTAEGRWRPWQFAWARYLRRRCDRIVCVSPSVREHHARLSGLPAEDYTVIPWGVDTEAFRRDRLSRRRLRAAWGIAPGEVVVAFVGRLEFYKGIDLLLAAMARLGQTPPSPAASPQETPADESPAAGGGESAGSQPPPGAVRLVIAGDGPCRRAVADYIAHGPGGRRARMLGHVQDVRAVLSAADVYLMPSLWEGWPLALGEAMSACLPAVGTNVPGVRDLIVPGQTGLLVAPGDPAALAGAVLQLAASGRLRVRLGHAGRRRIVEHFSIARTVGAHEELYEHIAGHLREH